MIIDYWESAGKRRLKYEYLNPKQYRMSKGKFMLLWLISIRVHPVR